MSRIACVLAAGLAVLGTSAGCARARQPARRPAPVASSPLPVRVTRPMLIVDTQGLAVLAGSTRTELPGTLGASAPGISPDGRWISWLTDAVTPQETLHLRRVTGGAARTFPGVGSAAWSPTADVLAMVDEHSIVLVQAGTAHQVSMTQKFPYAVAWPPDGSQLAYSGHPAPGEVFVSVSSAGLALTAPQQEPAADGTDDIDGLAGDGVLLWPNPSASGSLAADGLMLSFVTHTSGAAVTTPLTKTLTYRDWVQVLPAACGCGTPGVVAGGSRLADTGKTIQDFVLPTGAMGIFPPTSEVSPVRVPPHVSVVSLAIAATPVAAHTMALRRTVATITTVDSDDAGDGRPTTLSVQVLPARPRIVAAAGHTALAVASTPDGFLVVQPHALQLLRPNGQLLDLGELGAGRFGNEGYYNHVSVPDLVAIAGV